MKNKTFKVLAYLVFSLGCIAIPNVGLTQEVIKIGALYPLSGAMALLGTHNFNGVELATTIVNEKGGIQGKKIVFVKGDVPTAEAARSEAERLISVEKLKVLMGTYSSSLSYVATAVAAKHNVPYWETEAISDPITQRGFKYLFRISPTGSEFGNTAANFCNEIISPKLGIKPKDMRVTLMFEDSLFGTTVGETEQKRLKELGFNLLAVDSYSSRVTDLSSLVMKFKSLNPDIIVACSYLNDAILFQKQMKELKLYVKAFVGSGGGHGILDFAKALGKDSDGIFSSDFPLIKDPSVLDPKLDPPLKTVFERYKAKYGDLPDLHAMSGFTAATVFYQHVLPRALSLDPNDIRKAALEVDIPNGSTHMGWGVKYAGEGHPMMGTNLKAFNVMMQWQGGMNYCVWPKKYAEKEMTMVPLPPWDKR
jgi:branched-chain amino acid transport system substrate-binding protein